MLTVAEIIDEAGVPEGMVSILPMTRELGDRMVADDRFKLLTFTGSPVGRLADEGAGRQEEGRARAGRQRRRDRRQDRRPRLGGQARSVVGAFAYCRPGLHQRPAHVRPRGRLGRVHGQVRRRGGGAQGRATRRTRRPTSGRWSTTRPPRRTQDWVDEAMAMGGKVLLGGTADGTFFPPTVLTDVPRARPGLLERGVRAARRRVQVPRLRRRDRGRSTTASSASRPASSPTTCVRWTASTSSRSAA